jgi:hypothetical protein
VYNGYTASVLGSSLYDNQSDVGGGVWNGGDATFTNSTLSGNTAAGDGGGIYQKYNEVPEGLTFSLNYVTIYSNTANSDSTGGGGGGGIYMLGSTIAVSSTILAANTALTSTSTADCSLAGGTATSGGYNLFGVTSGCGSFAIGSDISTTTPGLAPLADNGGPTLTHALLPGSPAVAPSQPVTALPTRTSAVKTGTTGPATAAHSR